MSSLLNAYWRRHYSLTSTLFIDVNIIHWRHHYSLASTLFIDVIIIYWRPHYSELMSSFKIIMSQKLSLTIDIEWCPDNLITKHFDPAALLQT